MLTEQDRLIKLIGLVPFGRGGKRDCFVHPRDHAWCIKVPRLDRLPSILHRDASIFTRWRKSINDMDEKVQDWKVLDELNKTNQAETWKHLPRFGGWIETDRGQGLMIELVRDADHLISRSLLDYLWTTGHDERVREAVASFGDYWQSNTIPSRSLGLHNIAAQLQADGAMRLVLIDGLGSTKAIPLSKLSRTYGLHRARKKVTALREDIGALMIRKQKGLDPGPYGFLLSRE